MRCRSLACENFHYAGFLFVIIFKVEEVFVISLPHFVPSRSRAYDGTLCESSTSSHILREDIPVPHSFVGRPGVLVTFI